MPFYVACEQTHEQMGVHPALLPMTGGTHSGRESLDGAEPALHVGQALVGAHGVVAR